MKFAKKAAVLPESCGYSADDCFDDEAADKSIDEPPPLEDVAFPCSSEHGLVTWTVVFLLQLQMTHALPDKAVNSIFKFLKVMLKSFSDKGKKLSIERYWQCLPSSLYMALKRLNISSNVFEEFPVCPGCKSVYTTQECIETCGSRQKAKTCKAKTGYTICNTDILTVKKTGNGTIFRPIQTFCFGKLVT